MRGPLPDNRSPAADPPYSRARLFRIRRKADPMVEQPSANRGRLPTLDPAVRHQPHPLRSIPEQLFRAQFEKDMDFFRLFFLLMNKSCPMKQVDVVWAQGGPAGELGFRSIVGTVDALNSPYSRFLRCDADVGTQFCKVVNDYGRREADSCAVSDREAENRCRQTRKTQIYRCHAGLTEIAVPIIAAEEYIGTLFCGQVLCDPPSAGGLVQIQKDVARLGYIDQQQLAEAYWKIPVVSEEEVENTARILEAFAAFLATSWMRLAEVVREQHHEMRELQLLRKEFAHALLEGSAADGPVLSDLRKRLGLREMPNRVLVVRLESESEWFGSRSSFDVAFTAALQVIEELFDLGTAAVPAYLRKKGVCVFLHDRSLRENGHPSAYAYSVARQIIDSVSQRCHMAVRVGIGGLKADWQGLAESHQEACIALTESTEAIAALHHAPAEFVDASSLVEQVRNHLEERRFGQARALLQSLPLTAHRSLGEGRANLVRHRQFSLAVLNLACLAARDLGVERPTIEEMLSGATRRILEGAAIATVHEAYSQAADMIVNEVRNLYSSRQKKIVERACRLVDQRLSAPIPGKLSQRDIARSLGVSPSHFSRVFKAEAGITFERYVMVRRVEFAKRLLLDPLNNVSQVAERCGFSEPAYFARVFHKLAGCPPSRYMRDPMQC